MTRQYQGEGLRARSVSELEFLNGEQYVQRAREVVEECESMAPDKFMWYMLMEMYNRGRDEGAAAAILRYDTRNPSRDSVHRSLDILRRG